MIFDQSMFVFVSELVRCSVQKSAGKSSAY